MAVRQIRYIETDGPNWAERGFAKHEALYKAQVMEGTWGHLAPKQGRVYRGHIIFCVGCFGDLVVVDFEFRSARGKELDSSPWLYDDLHGFIGDCCSDKTCDDGNLYRFDGTYSQSRDDEQYLFSGDVHVVDLPTKRT